MSCVMDEVEGLPQAPRSRVTDLARLGLVGIGIMAVNVAVYLRPLRSVLFQSDPSGDYATAASATIVLLASAVGLLSYFPLARRTSVTEGLLFAAAISCAMGFGTLVAPIGAGMFLYG